MLEIKDVHKTFNPGTVNEKKALKGIDLKLEEGDTHHGNCGVCQ